MGKILTAAAALLLSGCATVVHGPRQKVPIVTHPPGAVCSIAGQSLETPTVVTLDRDTNYTVACKKPGYEPTTAFLSGRLSGWVFLDLLVFPVLIDYETGSAFTLNPETVDLTLAPLGGAPKVVAALPRRAWNEVRSEPEKAFAFLSSIEPASARSFVKEMGDDERSALVEYCVWNKGRAGTASWDFEVADLSPSESGFVMWLLSAHSQYKPHARLVQRRGT